MDIKEHILSQADGLFCESGIKSVTMDDIAKYLGMSKKTIYQHFRDKDELVYTLIKNRIDAQECVMEDSFIKARNAVEEIFHAVTEMHKMLSNMNSMLFYDLKKYHPDAWVAFTSFRENKLYKVIYDNLKRGIKEGLYRKEINLDILTRMRVDQVGIVFTHSSFPDGKYSIMQVMTELTEHFLYGLCTLKGHELINQYKHI